MFASVCVLLILNVSSRGKSRQCSMGAVQSCVHSSEQQVMDQSSQRYSSASTASEVEPVCSCRYFLTRKLAGTVLKCTEMCNAKYATHLCWRHTVKKLVQETCTSFLYKFFDFLSPASHNVCLSVRPQKVSQIRMKFGTYVEVDEWCTTVCRVTRSKVKVKLQVVES